MWVYTSCILVVILKELMWVNRACLVLTLCVYIDSTQGAHSPGVRCGTVTAERSVNTLSLYIRFNER